MRVCACVCKTWCRVSVVHRYTAMGVIMPPAAAMQGSSAWWVWVCVCMCIYLYVRACVHACVCTFLTDERLPWRSSCLISNPTTKKKIAIAPSLIQSWGDSAWPALWVCMSMFVRAYSCGVCVVYHTHRPPHTNHDGADGRRPECQPCRARSPSSIGKR